MCFRPFVLVRVKISSRDASRFLRVRNAQMIV